MATKSFGTILKVGDGASPEAFTAIAEILATTPPTTSSGTIDTTHMQTAGGYRTFIPDNFIDNGEASCSIQYDPDDLSTLRGYVNQAKNFEIDYPDSPTTSESFAGVITSFAPGEAGLEGKLEGTITVKVDGAIS